jgi:hypothetical protein
MRASSVISFQVREVGGFAFAVIKVLAFSMFMLVEIQFPSQRIFQQPHSYQPRLLFLPILS